MQVKIADQQVEVTPGQTFEEVLSDVLSAKMRKRTLACNCDGTVYDLTREIPENCSEIEPVIESSDEGLSILRHSAAHVMAEAVKHLFPSAKVTIGPDIENGFYYDFDFERPFTPDDLETIEKEMAKTVGQDKPFERRVVTREEAKQIFRDLDEDYKLELLDELPENEVVTIYTHGDFVDLCRGPHIPSTRFLKAYKLTSVAGAYWRGSEKNPMLQRIYGTAWPSPKDLKNHLAQLEEAKRRDHRRLGPQLDLFSFNDEAGPGMVLWHPKGALVRTILEDFEKKEHLKRGYQIVQGPQMLKRELWEKSGHYDNYRENMYFSEIDEQAYGIKPMNCLAHMLIYKSHVRSYRDLPLRFFELGTVHRHEKSGVLHGLLRVRQFTQDDAHLICRPDQLQEEIVAILRFVKDMTQLFGFEYELEISTRPEKSIGSDEDWERATAALKNALEAEGLEYDINEGDGAFYGPKIDVILKDALNRRWQCSTIQCDFTLPERFDLVYVGQDGERHRPAILHRVIFGSLERFLGILIEHFAGAFPTWLAPVQARILTITDAHNKYAEKCLHALRQAGIRAEVDLRNEKLGYKVREAQVEKIPFMLVTGEKEIEAAGVNVRLRDGKNLGLKTLEEVVDLIRQDCEEPFKRGGMSYSFAY